MRKIIFIEPNFKGFTHYNVNRSFLLAYINTYHDSKIHVVADESHIANIAKDVESQIQSHYIDYELETKKINRSGWNYYLAPWKRLKMYLKILKKIQVKSGDQLFFASNNEFDFFCGWLLSKRYTNINISFVCHANLNQIYTWQSKNPLRSFFQYKTALQRLAKTKIKLICLENLVAKNLIKVSPCLSQNIKIIPHPIDEIYTATTSTNNKDKLNIAFVGILSVEKRPELFEELTNNLDQEKFNCSVIGWAHDKDQYHFKNCIHEPKSSPLDQKLMLELLLSCDFICLLHDPEHYKLSASGVLLDAIKFEKPIIHLDSELVLDIEKRHGEVSITAPSIDELSKKLNIITTSEIQRLKNNLKKIQVTRHYNALKNDLYNLHQ